MSDVEICITGGSGYIGRNLARRLAKKYSVKILDVRSPSSLGENVKFVKCDITDFGRVKKCLEGCDIVVHTAVIQIPAVNKKRREGFEVNIRGTENVARAVDQIDSAKGMLLTGTWHVFGEHGIKGVVNESFGYRPDMVEERARIYALSKMVQEGIVRLYDEISDKIYGVIRLGTVLGDDMPPKTAANIFIENGLRGKPITPYRHSMYRPMLYVDIDDVCRAFEAYIDGIMAGRIEKGSSSLDHVVNLVYPEPITILDLAKIIQDLIIELTGGKVTPEIEIIDKGLPMLYPEDAAKQFTVDISRLKELLELSQLTSPKESLRKIIQKRIKRANNEL